MSSSEFNWTLAFILFNIGYFQYLTDVFAFPDEKEDYEREEDEF